MALIVCPECGKNFSDRATACPECGCPTSEIIGKNSETNSGQELIAYNAFDDGRYDEAYQLLAQLYSQNANNEKVVTKLALATAAKEYFTNGIPNSTKDLFVKGISLIKGNSDSQETFMAGLLSVVKDSKNVVDNMKAFVINEVSTAIGSTSATRSAGAMVADTLFSPIVSANRNLYEDRRTLENNAKILNSAIANKQKVTTTLDEFCSFVLKSVADSFDNPIDSNSELYSLLSNFVIKADDSKVYESLSNSGAAQSNVFGLCFGEEKTLLNFTDNTTMYFINDKVRVTGFAPPKGQLILTNYKVQYIAKKEKYSFTRSLEDLLRIEVGGPGGWMTHICLVFPNNHKITITPNPAGTQAAYVATLREQLKLSSR